MRSIRRPCPLVVVLVVVLVSSAAAACGGGNSKPRASAPTVPPSSAPSSAPPSLTRTSTASTGPTGPTAPTPAPTPAPANDPLAAPLDAILVNTNSCLVVTDGQTGALRYSHQAEVPMTPASTQKLFVAAAALDRLGPGYRFTTTVVSRQHPQSVVDDLWMLGGGDPLLASPEYNDVLQHSPVTVGYPTTPIDSLVTQIAATGIKSVRNGIHGDDHRHEALRYLPTWSPSINQNEFDVGPLSALEVDQGLEHWHPAVLAADPARHATDVLARMLAGAGTTAASAAPATAPGGTVTIASVASAPLSDIVSAMLRASDNQIAELIVREIDRQSGGNGTTVGGVGLVVASAAHLGLPTAGMRLVDGSGLSASNRVTCRALLGALNLGDQPKFAGLAALPVAGVNGTLRGLFQGTPMAGKLAAKGGYITGVSALVGRLTVGHPLRFAFVINGPFDFAGGLDYSKRVVSTMAAH